MTRAFYVIGCAPPPYIRRRAARRRRAVLLLAVSRGPIIGGAVELLAAVLGFWPRTFVLAGLFSLGVGVATCAASVIITRRLAGELHP